MVAPEHADNSSFVYMTETRQEVHRPGPGRPPGREHITSELSGRRILPNSAHRPTRALDVPPALTGAPWALPAAPTGGVVQMGQRGFPLLSTATPTTERWE